MPTSYGNIYWITGLPGAGKSTLAQQWLAELKTQGRAAVLLDGDQLRAALGRTGQYAPEQRLELALTYGRLCQLFAEQGLDVVCATVSLFHRVQQWNRKHLPHYTEIVLQASAEVLAQRDQKQLYSRAAQGTGQQIMGHDLTPEWPQQPEVVLQIDLQSTPESVFTALCQALAQPSPQWASVSQRLPEAP